MQEYIFVWWALQYPSRDMLQTPHNFQEHQNAANRSISRLKRYYRRVLSQMPIREGKGFMHPDRCDYDSLVLALTEYIDPNSLQVVSHDL